MAGLGVLFLFFIWFAVSFSILFFSTMMMKKQLWRWVIIGIFCPLVFIAPMADEIIGGYQFSKLCSEKLFFSVADNARGQTVTTSGIRKSPVNNMTLPAYEENWVYRSVNSDEIVLSWNVFHSEGGWLLRWLAGPTGGPFIFDGVCLSPKWKKSVFNDVGVYLVDMENVNE